MKENCQKAIMGIKIGGTLSHECICLIQEENRIEVFRDLEYVIKLMLQRMKVPMVNNQFTSRHLD